MIMRCDQQPSSCPSRTNAAVLLTPWLPSSHIKICLPPSLLPAYVHCRNWRQAVRHISVSFIQMYTYIYIMVLVILYSQSSCLFQSNDIWSLIVNTFYKLNILHGCVNL